MYFIYLNFTSWKQRITSIFYCTLRTRHAQREFKFFFTGTHSLTHTDTQTHPPIRHVYEFKSIFNGTEIKLPSLFRTKVTSITFVFCIICFMPFSIQFNNNIIKYVEITPSNSFIHIHTYIHKFTYSVYVYYHLINVGGQILTHFRLSFVLVNIITFIIYFRICLKCTHECFFMMLYYIIYFWRGKKYINYSFLMRTRNHLFLTVKISYFPTDNQ